jgi:phosphoribosylanthranilate isomerase
MMNDEWVGTNLNKVLNLVKVCEAMELGTLELETLNVETMKLKVCGMREADNIRAVEGLDIDYMGFIFYPQSPRYISPDAPDAQETREAIRSCRKRKVGVFVNAPLEEILQTSVNYCLDVIQLHGDEPESLVLKLKERGFEVIKSVAIDAHTSLSYKDILQLPDYLLFDTKSSAYGGSGKRFDWRILDEYTGNTPFILSGGITLDNCKDIVTIAHNKLYGIDLNSGFEIKPALKDVSRLASFIDCLKENTRKK